MSGFYKALDSALDRPKIRVKWENDYNIMSDLTKKKSSTNFIVIGYSINLREMPYVF